MTKYQTSPIPASSLKGGLAILKNISHLCPATKQVYDATRALKEEDWQVTTIHVSRVWPEKDTSITTKNMTFDPYVILRKAEGGKVFAILLKRYGDTPTGVPCGELWLEAHPSLQAIHRDTDLQQFVYRLDEIIKPKSKTKSQQKAEAFGVAMGKVGQVKINPDTVKVFVDGEEVKGKAVVNYQTGDIEVEIPEQPNLTGEEIQLVATPPNPKQHKTPKNLKINPPKA